MKRVRSIAKIRTTWRRRNTRAARLACRFALSIAALGGCAQDERPAAGPPTVPVHAASVVVKDVPVTVKAIGTVQASMTVNITAQVSGLLTHVAFAEGGEVTAGSLLCTIDPRPYRAALDEAISDSVRASVAAALAAANEQRYAELVGKDYVTRQEFDATVAQAAEARAILDASAARCQAARLDLDHCLIRSPLTGRAGNLLIEPGNLVRANDPNPLVVIRRLKPIWVAFAVPGTQVAEIRRRSAAEPLTVWAGASGDSTAGGAGELTFIDNAVDPSTGTIALKATFANEDERFWPGEFADVTVVLATRRNALVVPVSAIQQGQSGSFVYRIEPNSTVSLQPVEAAVPQDGEVVIVQGLQPNDRVVTDGQLRLTPGAKVEIKSDR